MGVVYILIWGDRILVLVVFELERFSIGVIVFYRIWKVRGRKFREF